MDIKQLYEAYKQSGAYTTDSRDVPSGSIFFALKGESFDGNKYAAAALDKGARLVVVDDREVFNSLPAGKAVLVESVLQAFKNVAREHRRQFNVPVIGITGTNGKTTTKELIAAVLSEKFNVLYTQGNFNNDVGVPKTLLRLTTEHDIAVVEMGASHPGDIKTLVETAEPTCGLITNVGRAHLQGFGSFEGVKRTKGELYDYLKNAPSHQIASEEGTSSPHRFAFLNSKDPDLTAMATERALETKPYAEGAIVKCDPYLNVKVEAGEGEISIRLQLVGSYNLPNVLAAVTIGRHFGVSDEQIKHALENYTPSNNRSQLTVTAKNHLVVDAYNANPTSMAAAIDNFRMIQVDAPKLAILGDMRELGEASAEEHAKIVEILKAGAFDEVWLVGQEFQKAILALSPEKETTTFRTFANVEEVKAAIEENHPEGFYILVKGSNGIRLFELIAAL